MAPVVPFALVVLLIVTSPCASGLGTLIALFPQPGLAGNGASWVIPSAAGSAVGGCTDLAVGPPTGGFGSAKIWWQTGDGVATCDASLQFFSTKGCSGQPAMSLSAGTQPAVGIWSLSLPALANTMYSALAPTQSVFCSSTLAAPTLPPSPPAVPAPPASNAAAFETWLQPLNEVRAKGNPSATPLAWNSLLSTLSQNWTAGLSAQMCGQPKVVLRKIPQSGYSESDVWMSFSQSPPDAVHAWAPNATDFENPRTARILDSKARSVGCGVTVCSSGAFFTCLFEPITY